MMRILKLAGIIMVVASFSAAVIFFILFLNESKNINIKKAQFKQEFRALRGGNMNLKSSAFSHNQPIPSKYTCDGENINPPFEISNVPANAKSLVLIADDPDAPMGTWVHWTAWNISPEIEEIGENSVPAGAVEGITSFGSKGYGGPCPPSGTHRYFFKLFALDTILDLPMSVEAGDIEKTMQGHIITKAELIGLYKRK